jgi:hypothetical protein
MREVRPARDLRHWLPPNADFPANENRRSPPITKCDANYFELSVHDTRRQSRPIANSDRDSDHICDYEDARH